MIPIRSRRSFAATLAIACVGTIAGSARASLMINDVNATYTIDFDNTVAGVNNGTYLGTGFAPVPAAGQLDSDAWATTGMSNGNTAFGATATTANTDFTRGAPPDIQTITTGGFYSLDLDYSAGVNRAFGIQPGGSDWTPGTVTLRLQNTSGEEITGFSVSYVAYSRNADNRANSLNFEHSADNSTYTQVGVLDYISPEAASIEDPPIPWVAAPRSTTLTGLSIPNGAFYYLRWYGDDVSGTDARDDFALDDITIRDVQTIPEPTALVLAAISLLSLLFFSTRTATASRGTSLSSSL